MLFEIKLARAFVQIHASNFHKNKSKILSKKKWVHVSQKTTKKLLGATVEMQDISKTLLQDMNLFSNAPAYKFWECTFLSSHVLTKKNMQY